MADAKQQQQQGQQGQETQIERRRERGGLARRGEFFPMISPREFLTASPFELMRRMTEEMDRVFGGRAREERAVWAPSVEVREQDNNLVISADLPGLKKEDVKIEVTDDALVIRGERKQEKEERREGLYRSEVVYGEFYRAIPLPEGADLEKAKAQFNNGVLQVSIPLSEAKRKPREIPIQEEPKTKTSGGGA